MKKVIITLALIISAPVYAEGFASRVVQSSATYMAARATTDAIDGATSKISSSLKTQKTIEGEAVRILDGDTVDIMSEGKPVRVRFDSIDAPEKSQPFGQKAKETLSEWIAGQHVVVKVNDTDMHGRLIGVVFLEGVNINRALVEKGYAFAYRQYLKDETMIQLEQKAQSSHAGVWSLPESQIVKPWDYRKSH
ncbi:thermonuclease family protein [Pseudomonas viridiflava]|uniref:thermonuclease family protein n=1 Tax=Pseudomonas viridiflava TaxID=33069 RepID=UPI0018E5FC24|nr:thermonuclease family protein [Pseudomonas viridiflava]MBI6727052.1 thermonuclease family protein [Pseudomonas viridiflava]